MARTSASTTVFSNPNNHSLFSSLARQRNINGRIIRSNNGNLGKILQVIEAWTKSGLIGALTNTGASVNAHKILNAMGCSVVLTGELGNRSYNMCSNQTDTEVIDNPNKIELKQYAYLKKEKIKIINVIKDVENSFYRLDSDIPNFYKDRQLSRSRTKLIVPNVTTIVSKLLDLNAAAPPSQRLRVFAK